jgi:hypothetical protein
MTDFTINGAVVVSTNKVFCDITSSDIYIIGVLYNLKTIYIKCSGYSFEYEDHIYDFKIGDTVNIDVSIGFSYDTNVRTKLESYNIELSKTVRCGWLNTEEPAFTLREISMVRFGLDNYFRRSLISDLFNIPVHEVSNITRKICKRLLNVEHLDRLSDLSHTKYTLLRYYINIYFARTFPEEEQIMNSLKDKPEVLNAYYKSL